MASLFIFVVASLGVMVGLYYQLPENSNIYINRIILLAVMATISLLYLATLREQSMTGSDYSSSSGI